MQITIVGAGAMGSLFASRLASAGKNVTLIDEWQDQIDAVKKEGIYGDIQGKTVHVKVPIDRPENVKTPADLMVFFVKSMQLEANLKKVSHLITKDTMILSLLNGIGHERIFSQYIPIESLIMGVTLWTSALDSPGHFHSGGEGSIELQNFIEDDQAKSRAMKIVDVLNAANLHASYSENVKYSIWRKACVNGTFNTLCSLLETSVGEMMALPHAQRIIQGILHEFSLAASLNQVRMDEETIYQDLKKISSSQGVLTHYPSMYQDLIIHKRPTEIDYLNGHVSHVLEKAGKEAPICRLLTDLIHSKEDFLL